MPTLVAGAALVDRSGTLLAADAGFLTRMGLEGPDPAAALRARAEASPELRALLSGEGPALATLPDGDGAVDVERVPAADGAFLVARDAGARELGEHALRSQVLARVVAGVAHEIKNPLNAISLRMALLEGLDGASDAAQAAAGHIGAVREQIGRVNEVVRRLVDATDPGAPLGYTDVASLLNDVACLFGYEARRRRVEVAVAAPPGSVRTRRDPARVARLMLVLYGRALAATPDGGRLAARVRTQGAQALLEVDHAADDSATDLGYDWDVLAAGASALGGKLEQVRTEAGLWRLTLALPGSERE
jgi:signal transduction histidine kinase